jgi:hypothetical protein
MTNTLIKSAYIGSSVAISWAWGTSLILGMQIARTQGVEAFGIWAVANTLTLLIFGILYKKKILFPEVLDSKPVKIFTNIIQMFCLLIQLKILNETLCALVNPITAFAVTAGISSFLVLWMYRGGLKASIFTDLIQGIGTMLVLGGMALYCLFTQDPQPLIHSDSSSLLWGVWSACILLSGIMTDIQHWQRAEVNGNGHAFEFASFFFALYLILVFLLSIYNFDGVLNVLLLLAVLGVTTSTIDSIAVALHRSFGRKLGTCIGLSICVGYSWLLHLSVLELWSYFGIIRVGLALYILYWCFKHKNDSLA